MTECQEDDNESIDISTTLQEKQEEMFQTLYERIRVVMSDAKEYSGCLPFRCQAIGFHQRFCPRNLLGSEDKKRLAAELPSTDTSKFLSLSEERLACEVAKEVLLIMNL